MRGDRQHAVMVLRRHGLHHGAGDRAARAHRRADHHQVGAGDGFAWHRSRALREAQRFGLGERRFGAGAGDDLIGEALAAHHQRQ
jgi:hypothetical protein